MPHVSYFWDEMEDNVVEEYDGDTGNAIATHTTEPTKYGSVLSQDRGGEKRYFQFDGLGNTTELTNASGDVTDTRRYSAFGETTASSGVTPTPLGFGGRWGYHSSGGSHVCIRRRPCLVSRGRWSSTDPAWYVDGVNMYVFARNNVTRYIDPTGLASLLLYRPSTTYFPSCHCGQALWKWFLAGPSFPGVSMYVVQRICFTVAATRCAMKCGCTPDERPETGEMCILEQLSGEDGQLIDTEMGVVDFWQTPHIVGVAPCLSRGTASISTSVVATNDKALVDRISWQPAGELRVGGFTVNVGRHVKPVPAWFDNVWSAWFNNSGNGNQWSYQSASGHLVTSWDCCPIDKVSEGAFFGKFGVTLVAWQGRDGFGHQLVNCRDRFENRV